MIVFDWDEIRPKLREVQLTREAVIKNAFQQVIDGSECYNDLDSLELDAMFTMFRGAWIICEHITRGL
jgi:hypothetical protein